MQKARLKRKHRNLMETTLTHKMVPTEGKTPYAALGNLPIYVLSLIFVLLRGFTTLLKRRLNLSQK